MQPPFKYAVMLMLFIITGVSLAIIFDEDEPAPVIIEEVIPEPVEVLVEPPILIEGFTCHRKGNVLVNPEDYEVTLTVTCSMELLSAYYLAVIPGEEERLDKAGYFK